MTKLDFSKIEVGDKLDFANNDIRDRRHFPSGIYKVIKKEGNLIIIKGQNSSSLAISNKQADNLEFYLEPPKKKTEIDIIDIIGSDIDKVKDTIQKTVNNGWTLDHIQSFKKTEKYTTRLFFSK